MDRMKVTRALLSALLLGGTCASLFAQTKVVETAPGTKSPGGTNSPAPGKPPRIPGGNLFDQIYRPSSIDLAPLNTRPSSGSGGGNIDPALRKRLMEEQARKKNWAIESAARMNRNGGDMVSERRRPENDGRKPAGAAREPTAAEVRLQAVDPEYAREYQRNSTFTPETAQELARRQARQSARGKDSRAPRNPDDPRDSTDPESLAEIDHDPGATDGLNGKGDSKDQDRWSKSPLDGGALGSRVEGAIDRAAAEQGLDILARGNDSTTEALAPRLESLRTERENELAEILGTSNANGKAAGATLTEGFGGTTRSSRLADFQQLLASEPPPAAMAPKLGAEPSLSVSTGPLGDSGRIAGLTRDLPSLTAPGASLNLGPAPAAAIAPPPRLAPRPTQLPFPVRGKGGF